MEVKDQVKGTIDDVAGRAKRQVGEWTGDTNAQIEGAVQQVKGKAEKAWGNVKDAAKDVKSKVQSENDKSKTEDTATGRP
ncbi:MAG: CsbD family protein [Terracidiphilus sp.]